jgi:TM2 domain-containing membrane protein YozV
MSEFQAQGGATGRSPAPEEWDRGIAIILSCCVPGLGQIYKGQTGRGLFWLLGGLCLFSVSWFLLFIPSFLYGCLCAYDASRPLRIAQQP